MTKPALFLSDWTELRSDYLALLEEPCVEIEEKVAAFARRLFDAGLPYSEFESLHSETVEHQKHDEAAKTRASTLRLQILSAYDRAFLDYQKLAIRYRSEVVDRRKISQTMSKAASALATSRDNLRSEVSVQHRLLEERSAELELLNKKISTQRDEMAGFLYSASHDLKSPMNTVKSLLSFFLEDHNSGDIDLSDIEDAYATATRTGVMLDDLLNFSQSLDAKPNDEIVDLNDLVADVFDDLTGSTADICADFVKDPLPKVMGSKFQLRLLFQNLISNGAKFCEAGKTPRVEVRNKGLRGLTHNAISVKDNGIGIDPAYHQNIFGLFTRLHVYEEYPGTGIGLSLCKRIVLNHQGQIHLQSAPGEGSTFTVVLSL